MKKLKVYYAHHIALYGSALEADDVETLVNLGFDVVNPNEGEHQDAYCIEGMQYFIDIVESCDAIAFRALPGGEITAGVFSELKVAMERNFPIVELPGFATRTILNSDTTRVHLLEMGATKVEK